MTFFILLLSLLLVSCAEDRNDPRVTSGINHEFIEYIQIYESIKGSNIRSDMSIQFDPTGQLDQNRYNGLCTVYPNGEAEILISEREYRSWSRGQRLYVIAHELVHCDLYDQRHNRDHGSLMYPYMVRRYADIADVYVLIRDYFNQH